MILLIVCATLCNAGQKKKDHRRGLNFEDISPGYLDPPKHEVRSHGWSPEIHDWNSETSDWNPEEVEANAPDEEEHNSHGESPEPIEPETWDEEQSQPWHNLDTPQVWSGHSTSESWPSQSWPGQPWPNAHGSKPWTPHSVPSSVKTIVKKIPVPYERPIRIENPVYTTVEKHIPIEHHVPVVKYVEKPVPKYVDNPIEVPVVKEEHVPQPYDQKVKVILQKIYVHVPSPPQRPRHTIIIRKKLHHEQPKKHKFFSGFL